jgi:hypothetical protein
MGRLPIIDHVGSGVQNEVFLKMSMMEDLSKGVDYTPELNSIRTPNVSEWLSEVLTDD